MPKQTDLRYLWQKEVPEIRVKLQEYFQHDIRGYKMVSVLNSLEYLHPELNLYWNWWNDDQLREVL